MGMKKTEVMSAYLVPREHKPFTLEAAVCEIRDMVVHSKVLIFAFE